MTTVNKDARIWLFRPWFCDEKYSTPDNIQARYKDLSSKTETTPNWIKSTTPATSLGIGAAIIGVLGFLIGSGKESGFGKFLGGLITIAGLVLAGIGKWMYGVDLSKAPAPTTNPNPAAQPAADQAANTNLDKQPTADQAVNADADNAVPTSTDDGNGNEPTALPDTGNVPNGQAGTATDGKVPTPAEKGLDSAT